MAVKFSSRDSQIAKVGACLRMAFVVIIEGSAAAPLSVPCRTAGMCSLLRSNTNPVRGGEVGYKTFDQMAGELKA
jgi:hypothetical protein